MTRYVSEMGGKNAILVDETADLDAASSGIVRSAFGFQGQKCSACSRLVVDARVKDRLLELVLEKTARLPAATLAGPVRLHRAGGQPRCLSRRSRRAIETGKGEARLVAGGHGLDRDGYFIAPTIFDDVQPGSLPGAGGDLRAGAGR